MLRRGVGLRNEVRAPRLQVLADGVALPGVMGADVFANNFLAADRFSVRLAVSAGGLAVVDAQGVRLDVQVALDGGWTSLVAGEADTVLLDPIGGVVDVEGRDLSALLVDTRVDETFANRTASEIAVELGGRHGLEVSADATGTLVGRYYQAEHDRLTVGRSARAVSEWDLLAFLAGQEGFDLFMDGAVLRFGAAAGEAVTVETGGCMHVSMEHALGMARSVEVTVRSWDQQGAAVVVGTAAGGGGGRRWKQGLVRANLAADAAQRLAERTLADLLRHERTVRLVMPGELGIRPRGTVTLQGTGTDWDRDYAVAEVSRHVDVRHGFTQRVRLQGVV